MTVFGKKKRQTTAVHRLQRLKQTEAEIQMFRSDVKTAAARAKRPLLDQRPRDRKGW